MPTFSTLQLNRNEFSRAHVRQPSTIWNEKKEESIVYSASRTVYLLLFISTLFILFFSSFNRFSLRHFSFILVFIFFFFVSLSVFSVWEFYEMFVSVLQANSSVKAYFSFSPLFRYLNQSIVCVHLMDQRWCERRRRDEQICMRLFNREFRVSR